MIESLRLAAPIVLVVVAGLSPFALAVIPADERQGEAPAPVVLVIHGGSGVLSKKVMTPALEKQYRGDLEKALRAGHAVLQKEGGTSLDAVEAAIKVLEDSPLFNAFTGAGSNELDASIMEGKEKMAGAVAGVTRVKNPISAARAVMERAGMTTIDEPP